MKNVVTQFGQFLQLHSVYSESILAHELSFIHYLNMVLQFPGWK